jgi:hypothetical protein
MTTSAPSKTDHLDIVFADMLGVMQGRLRDTLNDAKIRECMDIQCNFLRQAGQTGHYPTEDMETWTRLFFAPLDFKGIHPDVLIAAWADFMIDATETETDESSTKKRTDIMESVLKQVVSVWWHKLNNTGSAPDVKLHDVLKYRQSHPTLHSLLDTITSSSQ